MENVSTTDPFTEAGFHSIEAGAELFTNLEISPAELFPNDISKLQEIAKFANMFEDGIGLLNIVARKNSGETTRLNHVWEYVGLQNKKMAMKGELEKLSNEISLFE